jgi:ribosomal protein S18 acetylase RimI-like enzyme
VPAPMIVRLAMENEAEERAAELAELHADVYGGLAYASDPEGRDFAVRLRTQRRQPGFTLAVAFKGGYLLGAAMGMPLRPSTSWWRGVTAPLPDAVTAEHPGRTFALTDLMVRSAWRRQNIGRSLYEVLLADRAEERATVVVPPAATAAQAAFQNWGWQKVARTRTAAPGAAADVLTIDMPAAHAAAARARDWWD